MKIPDWLKKMPKVEIHCHIGGSLRLDTILELAEQNSIKLPGASKQDLKHSVVFKDKKDKSLHSYLECIKICESVLQKPEDFSRAAYEICEDAHSENVQVMELRFGPTNYENGKLKLFEIVEGALDGLARAKNQFGMYTGLIICGIRTDIEATRRAAQIAVNYQDNGVVGFDLAGKERGFRPKTLIEVIHPVLDNFLPVTIHAGEEDSVASIAEAVRYLHADRIGHGITLRESGKLFNYIDEGRIALEICPTSNVDTGSVASISTHPIRAYHKAGLRISVNTDNRTISDTTLSNEYIQLMNQLGFDQRDIFMLARHAIKAAFLRSDPTKKLLNEFDKYVTSQGIKNWSRYTTE